MLFDFLYALLAVWSIADAQKVLVYNSKYGHSHSNFLGTIADTLVEAGMDVTSLIPVLNPMYGDGTKKSKIIKFDGTERYATAYQEGLNRGDFSSLFKGANNDPTSTIKFEPMLSYAFTGQCNETIHSPGLIEKLTEEHFDVMITENFDFCGHGIFHLIKAKSFISVSSAGIFDYQAYEVGVPLVPSALPGTFGGIMKFDGSITERIWNLYGLKCAFDFFGSLEYNMNKLFRNLYGPNFPTISETTAQSAFVFTNTDPFVDFARPSLRKVVDIGGIGVRESNPLEQKWQDILSLRKRSVLFSFGSVARSFLMPEAHKKAIVQAMSNFPDVTFIWKYERDNDTHARGVPNIILSPWTPQTDLLNDPRVVGMITHAGKGSVTELSEKGVPAIFVPLFGDQARNSGVAAHLGFGFIYEKEDLSKPDVLTNAIRELLENKRYRENAKRVQKIIASRPFTPQELLVKHVKFAAEVGPVKALEPMGNNYSYFIYFNIDIILIAIAVLIAILSVLVYSIFKLMTLIKVNVSSFVSQSQKQKAL